jgi:hypothetical protein
MFKGISLYKVSSQELPLWHSSKAFHVDEALKGLQQLRYSSKDMWFFGCDVLIEDCTTGREELLERLLHRSILCSGLGAFYHRLPLKSAEMVVRIRLT